MKQVNKMPSNIRDALIYWTESVERLGIREIRKIPSYHDEPLQGFRFGQRSIRLNRSYRAIYREINNHVELCVIEVTKHAY